MTEWIKKYKPTNYVEALKVHAISQNKEVHELSVCIGKNKEIVSSLINELKKITNLIYCTSEQYDKEFEDIGKIPTTLSCYNDETYIEFSCEGEGYWLDFTTMNKNTIKIIKDKLDKISKMESALS